MYACISGIYNTSVRSACSARSICWLCMGGLTNLSLYFRFMTIRNLVYHCICMHIGPATIHVVGSPSLAKAFIHCHHQLIADSCDLAFCSISKDTVVEAEYKLFYAIYISQGMAHLQTRIKHN